MSNLSRGKAPRCLSKVDGFHVVRRSNQWWTGLSSDLILEHTVGLTRGSGMTEDMRNLWTLSVPVTSEHNSAMKDFNDLTYTTSPQNASDLEKNQIKLAVCSPFTYDPTLRNIVNRIMAGADVIK
jgi:hypothetical protein